MQRVRLCARMCICVCVCMWVFVSECMLCMHLEHSAVLSVRMCVCVRVYARVRAHARALEHVCFWYACPPVSKYHPSADYCR